jgi:hypothetical protein
LSKAKQSKSNRVIKKNEWAIEVSKRVGEAELQKWDKKMEALCWFIEQIRSREE